MIYIIFYLVIAAIWVGMMRFALKGEAISWFAASVLGLLWPVLTAAAIVIGLKKVGEEFRSE
jgi:hypothetical protein